MVRQARRMDSRINFPDSFGTCFSVSVDTEEEFEWGEALSRTKHRTASVPAISEGQRFFEAAGVTPLYYVDQPVIDSDEAVALFRQFIADGTADFGVHLHPWVTPPFDEIVSRPNSYAGNLPEAMERAKLRHVRNTMIARLGISPVAYRAGRYGIGANSLRILAEEGFLCDSSVRSLFDYREDGGPDYRWSDQHPWRTGPDGRIVELPLTSVFLGRASRSARQLYGRIGKLPTLKSMLARFGLVERVPLTPEGIPAEKACQAIDVALEQGIRLLSMSFHSPSLAIGNTPYVRDAKDLRTFYAWFDKVFDQCARRGVQPTNLGNILDACGVKL
jgi:hypothetical protein